MIKNPPKFPPLPPGHNGSPRPVIGRFTWFVIFSAMALFVGGSALMNVLGIKPGPEPVRPGAEPPVRQSRPARRVSLGQSGTLISGDGTSTVFLATDEAALSEMVQGFVLKDKQRVVALAYQGKLFMVTAGTQARLIDGGMMSAQVRIIGGPKDGRAGWIPAEYIIP